MADHDTHDHTGIPGVGGTTDLDTILAASSGQDIADALTGAAAPDAGNVFATMADLGGGGGAQIWLARFTGNNTSPNINITGLINSTYDVYLFEFNDILPATNNVLWQLRTSTDGGTNYDAGGSDYTVAGWRWHSAGAGAFNGGAAAQILCSGGDGLANNSSWGGVSGWAKLYNPLGAKYKKVQGYAEHADQTLAVFEATTFTGVRTSTTAVDAVRFLLSSGNIVSGTVDVYGITHA